MQNVASVGLRKTLSMYDIIAKPYCMLKNVSILAWPKPKLMKKNFFKLKTDHYKKSGKMLQQERLFHQ